MHVRVEGNRLLARGVKEVSIRYDNLERRIVVIIHLLKQEGILCTNSYKDIVLGYSKAQHSDGSSPVTTQMLYYPIFLHLLLKCKERRFYSDAQRAGL